MSYSLAELAVCFANYEALPRTDELQDNELIIRTVAGCPRRVPGHHGTG